MTSRTSNMSWLEWRRRTERCIMAAIREMVREQWTEMKACHYALRTFHRLASICDLLQPIAETCDRAGQSFLSQFQLVLNEVVTQLEHCILQACVGRGGPGGLEAMLNEELVSLSDFDRGIYDDSQNDIPLKDAPTPDEFVASLISVSSSVSSVSPAAHAGHALKSLHEIERALNSLQEIERAWVGSLVD